MRPHRVGLLRATLNMIDKNLSWMKHPTKLALHRQCMLECSLMQLGLSQSILKLTVFVLQSRDRLCEPSIRSQKLLGFFLTERSLSLVLLLDYSHNFLLHL